MNNEEVELLDVDLADEDQLKRIHKKISHSKSLIFDVLEKQSLRNIRTDPKILHSDAYNHVELVRSCQGMTGTPWNHSTYHQRLVFDNKMSQGTDGLVYQSLNEKEPTIIGYDFNNTQKTINDLFNRHMFG